MTKGTTDKKSRKPIVICGLIITVTLVILLAWRCNAISQEPSDEDYQMLYDTGYAYPSDVELKIVVMAVGARIECSKMGLTEEECPQPTTDTARRVLATLMTKRTETKGPGQYGNVYNAEFTAAINRLFYGLIERLQQNPCGPLEYGYVSDRTLNELQASGYIHKCAEGWAINSEWAELIVVQPQSQSSLQLDGLEGIDQSAGNTSCDRNLRSALITHPDAGSAKQVNQIIREIQAQRAADCNQEVWNPFAHIVGTPPGGTAITTEGFSAPCANNADPVVPVTIGNTETPTTLANLAKSRFGNATYGGFARDASGNILVEFHTTNRPTDNSQCWLYVARSNYWDAKQ